MLLRLGIPCDSDGKRAHGSKGIADKRIFEKDPILLLANLGNGIFC